MNNMRVITIIGSRKTPTEIQGHMRKIAEWCTGKGIVVRSGKAGGADAAAIYGCMDAYTRGFGTVRPEMYVPWAGFGSEDMTNSFDINTGSCLEASLIAQKIHPAWTRCSDGAKKLHTRNVHQILGVNLDTPSDVVLYWCTEVAGAPTGGTATAVNLAKAYGCTCINMLHDSWKQQLKTQLVELTK